MENKFKKVIEIDKDFDFSIGVTSGLIMAMILLNLFLLVEDFIKSKLFIFANIILLISIVLCILIYYLSRKVCWVKEK